MNVKKLVIPMIILGAFACANEPETEVAETETIATETATPMVDTDASMGEGDWWVYSDWDTDANQQIARNEFDQRWQSGFGEWDVDGDGALGPDESADTFYDWFDRNNDNIIDENEWNAGTERWRFDNVTWGDWNTWDSDANAELSETEWRAGWNNNVWSSWDADGDGVAGRDEMADTFWDFFDGNDDDIVDAGEWGNQG